MLDIFLYVAKFLNAIFSSEIFGFPLLISLIIIGTLYSGGSFFITYFVFLIIFLPQDEC